MKTNKLSISVIMTFLAFLVLMFSVAMMEAVAAEEKKKKKRKGIYTFGGTNIVGLQEAAKSLVLVPWKQQLDWSELKRGTGVKRKPIDAINPEIIDQATEK